MNGFRSLNRHKSSSKSSSSYGGQKPVNTLASSQEPPPINITQKTSPGLNHPITTTRDTKNTSEDWIDHKKQHKQAVVSPRESPSSLKVHRRQELNLGHRDKLKNVIPTVRQPQKSVDPEDDSNEETTTTIRDIKGLPMSPRHSRLYEVPKCQLSIKLANKNGRTFNLDPSVLLLNISKTDEYMFVTSRNTIVLPLVIHKFHHLNQLMFSETSSSILLVLKHGLGYVLIKNFTEHSEMYSYCKRNNWPMSSNPVTEAFIEDKMIAIDKERFSSSPVVAKVREEPKSLGTSYQFKKVNDSVSSVPPSSMYRDSKTALKFSELSLGSGQPATYTRSGRTRSETKKEIDEININSSGGPNGEDPYIPGTTAPEDQVVPLETPAPFAPPLEFKFLDGKPFTIAYNDFKTLYNNDWVNDNIIDFFIRYEIDRVVEKGLLKMSDIYTFNTFFYLKLITKKSPNDLEEIDYYGNIKRWLTKVDLFSYSNVIVPINEKSHWYACIIVGLPEFLQKVRSQQSAEEEISVQDEPKNDKGEESDSSMDKVLIDSENLDKKPKGLKYPGKINIFVFDSLSQKHGGLLKPFKRFLIDYCKERYNLSIDTKDIVFRQTRVLKQNNFNDCGIHVIYNIRKFLNNRDECLRIWDRNEPGFRNFFKSSERSRKQLIDLLLTLHQKQEGTSGTNDDVTPKEATNEGKELDNNQQSQKSKTPESESGTNTQPNKESDSSHKVESDSSDGEVELLDFRVTNPVRVDLIRVGGRRPVKRLQVTIPMKSSGPSSAGSDIFEFESSQETVNHHSKELGSNGHTKSIEPQSQMGPEHKVVAQMFEQIKKYESGKSLKNRSLRRNDEIRNGISETTTLLLNSLFSQPRQTFTNEQLNEILVFKKLINGLEFIPENMLLLEAFLTFRRKFRNIPGPNDEVFKINHDQGVIKEPKIEVTDKVNDKVNEKGVNNQGVNETISVEDSKPKDSIEIDKVELYEVESQSSQPQPQEHTKDPEPGLKIKQNSVNEDVSIITDPYAAGIRVKSAKQGSFSPPPRTLRSGSDLSLAKRRRLS